MKNWSERFEGARKFLVHDWQITGRTHSFATLDALVQTFNANVLNQYTNATRSGTLTVAGTTSSNATSVTVNSQSATRYADFTFAKDGFTLTNGDNTFTAVASDGLGRSDSQSITVNLPATNSFSYDLNGNMLTNPAPAGRFFEYDDENQLIRVTEPTKWKSEFTYDGKMRRRVRKEYLWQNSSWALSSEVRYVYDGNLPIQERDANNLATVSYTRGRDLSGSLEGAGGIGGLLARTDHSTLNSGSPSTASAHAYYHAVVRTVTMSKTPLSIFKKYFITCLSFAVLLLNLVVN